MKILVAAPAFKEKAASLKSRQPLKDTFETELHRYAKGFSSISKMDFVATLAELDTKVNLESYDIIIVWEQLVGNFLSLESKESLGGRIIFVIEESDRNRRLREHLFQKGHYDALYVKDATAKGILNLYFHPRERTEAKKYYLLQDMEEVSPAWRIEKESPPKEVMLYNKKAWEFVEEASNLLSARREAKPSCNRKESIIYTPSEILKNETIEYFSKNVNAMNIWHSFEKGAITMDEFKRHVERYVDAHKDSVEVKREAFELFCRSVFEYDMIQPLIDDEDISDIKIHGYNKIFIKRWGKREKVSDICFRNEEDFRLFVSRVASKNHMSISDNNAILSFTDKTTSNKFILRISVSTGYVNTNGLPVIHFRKQDLIKRTPLELIERNMLSAEEAMYLIKEMQAGSSFLFSGQGGSGKTTLLNMLMEFRSRDLSSLTIQVNEEVFDLDDEFDAMYQHPVENRGEGNITYSLKDLATQGLVTDIDLFCIGEIKGREARYAFVAADTGSIYLATLHADSNHEVLGKFADYVKYDLSYQSVSHEYIVKRMAKTNPILIHMYKYKVMQITRIVGWDEEKMEPIYKEIICGDEEEEK